MQIDHSGRCQQVITEIRRILALPHPVGGTFLGRFLYLNSVLQNQYSGTKGAGLTGGVQQESLWFEMLNAGNRTTGGAATRFARECPLGVKPTSDYDYYFRDYPLSHKTIGWNGSGELALAWSKNPEGGRQRSKFESSMLIVCSRKPPKRGMWVPIMTGIYLVPLPVLQSKVKLTSNNKSDSIIKSRDTIRCMTAAAEQGLFIPFTYDHEKGRHRFVSLWHSGPKSIRTLDS